MLGAIAGDIIGSRFEHPPLETTQFRLFHPACRFTDDAVLTVALADSLMHGLAYPDLLERYYRAYPRTGYGEVKLEFACVSSTIDGTDHDGSLDVVDVDLDATHGVSPDGSRRARFRPSGSHNHTPIRFNAKSNHAVCASFLKPRSNSCPLTNFCKVTLVRVTNISETTPRAVRRNPRIVTLTTEKPAIHFYLWEYCMMISQCRSLALIAIVVNFCINVPIALSAGLTDQWVDKAARPLVEHRVADGLSVGYIEGTHHGIVHLGSSSRAGKRPDNLTIYEIGSMSKVFTSLMLADAVARGEIDLNAAADVKNAAGIRLPSLNGRSITWIDLSTHRSGLPRIPTNLALTDLTNPYRTYDSKMAAAFLNQYKLPRPPGDSQEYSNLGASVLGYLVAQKAGKSYQLLLQERIAKPLRMTDCTVDLKEDQKKRLATPHDKFGSGAPPWAFSDLPGAGGIHATIRDMTQFAQAQLKPPTGKLGAAIEMAWKQQRNADASGPAMGLGWVIAADGQTRWHNGQTGGSHSAIFINRELQCAVVVLCNTALTNEVDQLAMQLVTKAAGQEPGEMPDRGSGPLVVDAKLRQRLEGRYQLTPSFIFTVRDQDGHLMVSITNQPTQEVFADSPTRWSYRGVDATLEFKLEKTGPAVSLILHQNGIQQTARRIE